MIKLGFRCCLLVLFCVFWVAPTTDAQEASPDTNSRAKAETKRKRQRSAREKPATMYWPKDFAVNKQIPTPKEFFGFEVGFRHLRHDQVAAYMQELARVSDRITIQQYAQTHGGRPNLMLTITSPENHGQLPELRRKHRQFSKPQGDMPSMDGIPVVMNMGYGVHGDEPSATNTSPLVAHFLAAAEGDEIEEILQNSIILLDPSLNPDGFDRFARWANTFRGRIPNPDSDHIEHNQGWPAGRVNYYWFDLNRDWLPLRHPESQSRMKWYHQWKPNVVLDFHEMGTNSTYFFQPGIPERKNPLTPIENVELTREMAKFHAGALDRIGSLYFTQEVFDDFYMGKGSTYPDLHGSVGILFEQGSSRGHIQNSVNGLVRFSDTIQNQFTASISSLRGASALREKLLSYQHKFYSDSLERASKSKIKTYVFQAGENASRLREFSKILIRHDIDCFWAQEDQTVGDRLITAGSLVVPAQQPEFRFLRSLVERRKQFQEPIFYDVSAWTLPLAFNLRQFGLPVAVEEGLKKCRMNDRPEADQKIVIDDKTVALMVDWRDDEAVPFLQQLLKQDLHVRVAMRPMNGQTEQGTQEFPFGTLAIPLGVQQNKDKRREIQRLARRAQQRGVSIQTINSGLAMGGIDLGSNNFPRIQAPKVALLVGGSVSAYQAGAVWHQLDFRTGMPVSLLSTDRIRRADPKNYNTVVVVSGGYDSETMDWLDEVLAAGGTVIGISRGASSIQRSLLQLQTNAGGGFDSGEDDESDQMPKFSEARKKAALAMVNGAIFQTKIDGTHPLMFGFETKHLPVFRGSTSLLAHPSRAVDAPALYTDQPLLAGYASQANENRIAGSPAVTVHSRGAGRVILIIDDPNFRAFWPSTSRLFMNSIYFGQFAR